jgi:hypothetical protein
VGDAAALRLTANRLTAWRPEFELTYRAADELRLGVTTASITPISSLGVSISWLLPSRVSSSFSVDDAFEPPARPGN